MNKRKVSFEEALTECIQHYVDRGYSVEHATEYVNRGEAEVFRVYDIIQEEKKRGILSVSINLLSNPEEPKQNESEN